VEDPEADADVEGVRIEAAVAAKILYVSSHSWSQFPFSSSEGRRRRIVRSTY